LPIGDKGTRADLINYIVWFEYCHAQKVVINKQSIPKLLLQFHLKGGFEKLDFSAYLQHFTGLSGVDMVRIENQKVIMHE
jgi:hypothetical protein